MLAHRLNGENLSADHGFPLRLIIPRMYAYIRSKMGGENSLYGETRSRLLGEGWISRGWFYSRAGGLKETM